jgi:hypothetical protein
MTALAVAIVRAWTFVYTVGLPTDDRERRRAEIESDLWENANDPAGGAALAGRIISRLILGLVDDVRWRVEQTKTRASQRQALAVMLTAAVLLLFVWIGVTTRHVDPPQPPEAPDLDWRHRHRPAPPPPPPPPPPCNPPGIGRPAFSPCTPYR